MGFTKKRNRPKLDWHWRNKQLVTSNTIDNDKTQTSITVVTEATEDAVVFPVAPSAYKVNANDEDDDNDDDNDNNAVFEDKEDDEELKVEGKDNNTLVKGLIDKERALRMAIAYFYVVVYDCMAKVDWKQNNLINKIKASASIPKSTNIKPIIADILDCKKRELDMMGKH